MHGIGNECDAQEILSWVRGSQPEYGQPSCVRAKDAPEGWKFLGMGSFRSVWLSPDGVAYKVGHYSGDYQSGSEVIKLGNAHSKGAPEGCRIPKFSAFYPDGDDVVIAIEAINGKRLVDHGSRSGPFGNYYDLLSECEIRFRLNDLHDENAIVDEDGYLVPVDFGD